MAGHRSLLLVLCWEEEEEEEEEEEKDSEDLFLWCSSADAPVVQRPVPLDETLPFIAKVVAISVVVQRQFPIVQSSQKTIEVPRVRYIVLVVDVPVVQVPHDMRQFLVAFGRAHDFLREDGTSDPGVGFVLRLAVRRSVHSRCFSHVEICGGLAAGVIVFFVFFSDSVKLDVESRLSADFFGSPRWLTAVSCRGPGVAGTSGFRLLGLLPT